MIATDENALICDLAETYHIYDYRSLPVSRVAIFCVGLRNNSRIKMKMNKMKYPIDTLLLASMVDKLALILWSKSKDATKGIRKPKSVLNDLLKQKTPKDIESFNTPDEFRKARYGKEKNRWN